MASNSPPSPFSTSSFLLLFLFLLFLVLLPPGDRLCCHGRRRLTVSLPYPRHAPGRWRRTTSSPQKPQKPQPQPRPADKQLAFSTSSSSYSSCSSFASSLSSSSSSTSSSSSSSFRSLCPTSSALSSRPHLSQMIRMRGGFSKGNGSSSTNNNNRNKAMREPEGGGGAGRGRRGGGGGWGEGGEVEGSGRLILLGVPQGSEIGLDMFVRHTGPSFTGFRSVAPGAHYVYFAPNYDYDDKKGRRNAADLSGLGSVRMGGEWVWIGRGQAIVRRYAEECDKLLPLNQTDEERMGELLSGYGSPDTLKYVLRGLADANQTDRTLARNRDWRRLTSFISGKVVDRLIPPRYKPLPSLKARPEEQLYERPFEVGDDVIVRTRGDKPERLAGVVLDYAVGQSEKLPVRLKERNKTVLAKSRDLELVRALERPYYHSAAYTRVPHGMQTKGFTPQEVTKLAMDSTCLLELMLRKYCNNDTSLLLGELQYAYISAVIGSCTTGLHQWKQLITLLCNCEQGLELRRTFFDNFASILIDQIDFVPADYEGVGDFLRPVLDDFIELLRESGIPMFMERARNLKSNLEAKFGWEWHDDLGT